MEEEVSQGVGSQMARTLFAPRLKVTLSQRNFKNKVKNINSQQFVQIDVVK
jgi:hypothetical protein